MTTKRTSKPAQAKSTTTKTGTGSGKTATVDTDKDTAVAAGLAKFIQPGADTGKETVPEQEDKEQDAAAPVEAQDQQDTTKEESGTGTEQTSDTNQPANTNEQEDGAVVEVEGGDVPVVVLVDAVAVKPGLLVSKGQTVELPAATVERLIGLDAVRRV